MLKLGFHYHIPVVEREGTLRTHGALAGFMDSLAVRVEHLWAMQHTARTGEETLCDTELEAPNITFISLGPHDSIPRRAARWRWYRKTLEEVLPGLDVLLIRGPSPLLPRLGAEAARHGVKTALLLVGDYVKGVSTLPQPRWRKELIRAWSVWNKLGQNRLARKSLVFVNSRELYTEYKGRAARLVETRTTTLSEGDFHVREDTCRKRPIRLLYAGRYDLAKGLLDILEALHTLVAGGLDIEWQLVGWEDGGTRVMDRLMEQAAHLGVRDRVIDHGMKKVGPELFSMYRSADIFVVASQKAEGFPRTIWEAMASSLPVVATKVGSIPHFLENEAHALVVPPKNPRELAEAIGRMVREDDLRRRIIANAFSLASENTLERRATEMVQELLAWVREGP